MVCVIIPSLNPSTELISYVRNILDKGLKPVIVNDGSNNSYDNIFDALQQIPGCIVLTHKENKGKGAALKTGYSYFQKHCSECTGVITADADGQHDIEDILKISQLLEKNSKNQAILGQRNLYNKSVPIRSRIGNASSAILFSLLYGCKIPDTQSGLRGFSADLIPLMLSIKGERYDYEMTVLSYLQLKNIKIIKIPIKTIYIDNNKGSHYRTFYDTAKIFIRIISTFLRYAVSSFASAITDIAIFAICFFWVFADVSYAQKVFLCTVIARITSSLVNYYINHKIVFFSKMPHRNTVIKYYMLWCIQLLTSYFLVLKFSAIIHINTVFLKYIIDLFLALISYQIQLRLVFKNKDITI
jgi:hypothetical protein